MTDDPRTRLMAVLERLGAADLARQLWAVREVRELPPDVRGAIVDVLGARRHSAASTTMAR